MRPLLPVLALTPLLLLAACPEPRPGNEMDEAGWACQATATVLAPDEATPLGFTAEERMAQISGPSDHVLTWAADGSHVDLTIEAVWDGGEVRWMDSEPVDTNPDDDGMEPAIGLDCQDWLEIDVTLTFATVDGVFDETWSLPLEAGDDGPLSFEAEIDEDEPFGGTFDPWDHADPTADYETLATRIAGEIEYAGGGGEVMLIGTGVEECDDEGECTAWASQEAIAEWSAQMIPEG